MNADRDDLRTAVDALEAPAERLRTLAASCDDERSLLWEAGPGGGCSRAITAEADVDRLRAALLVAVRQNEHDMLMTGDELRACRAALAGWAAGERSYKRMNMQRNYTVWSPDLGQQAEDGKDFGGGNDRDAATGWAEWNDCHSAEYAIASGAERRVCVLDKVTGHVSKFTVTGWSMPCYSAKPA